MLRCGHPVRHDLLELGGRVAGMRGGEELQERVLAAGHHALHITGKDALEWLLGGPLGMLSCQGLYAVEREGKLEVHRLLGPQRAVVVEHGDACGWRHVVGASVRRHPRDEGREGLPGGPVVPGRKGLSRRRRSGRRRRSAVRARSTHRIRTANAEGHRRDDGAEPEHRLHSLPVSMLNAAANMLASAALLERLEHLVEAEAADLLARRELLERGEESARRTAAPARAGTCGRSASVR